MAAHMATGNLPSSPMVALPCCPTCTVHPEGAIGPTHLTVLCLILLMVPLPLGEVTMATTNYRLLHLFLSWTLSCLSNHYCTTVLVLFYLNFNFNCTKSCIYLYSDDCLLVCVCVCVCVCVWGNKIIES